MDVSKKQFSGDDVLLAKLVEGTGDLKLPGWLQGASFMNNSKESCDGDLLN